MTNVSGRNWKAPSLKRTSSRVASKPLHEGYDARIKKSQAAMLAKLREAEMKAETAALKQQAKDARKTQEERRLANLEKSQISQKITNSRKLKNLKKKQLKGIVKR